MLSAIIVAAGSSLRMGFDKLFAVINNRPVVAHSIAAFETVDSVSEIIVVTRAERLTDFEELVRREGFRKVNAVVPGGVRRQDSVQRGLERLAPTSGYVAVHDAARPLVRQELIEQIYQCAREHGGAASGAAIIDTLKRVDPQHLVIGGVERANLFAVETPQIFQRDLLERAFRTVVETGVEVTDEISAVEMVGGKIVLVPNDEPNFKITYPADLALAKFILGQRVAGQPPKENAKLRG